jgi:protease IV
MKRAMVGLALAAGILCVVADGGALGEEQRTTAARPAAPELPSALPAEPVFVDLTLKGKIHEDPTPLGLDGAPVSDNLQGIVNRISRAKADPKVKGLVVRLRDIEVGWAKSNELRSALKTFRSSGKKVFAILETAQNHDYLVATAADEIVMPEGGMLLLKGLAAEVMFYRALFDKLEITPDMLQVGQYKAAAEPYTRTRMSPAFREELTSVVGDSYALLAEAIAARQGIALEEARKLINGGPYTPAAAKAAGLINRIAYPDQLQTELAKALRVEKVEFDSKYGQKRPGTESSGLAGIMKMLQALSGESAKKPGSDKPKIALIYASGMIVVGKSSSGSMLGEQVLGSDTLIKNLKAAETDETVKAIVLRVDSPGGSALASDLVWRETVRIKKPIVASMSDVAGSGGYYICMGCDRVLAEPGTVTGSIGVLGGKIVFGGLLEKLGLTVDTVTVGKNGTMFSALKPFAPPERDAMRGLLEETYHQFVAKAALGRKMKYDDLEKLARGRIYTGRQAKEKGLVDDLGTVADAIASAKELAGLERDAETELMVLPAAKGVLESLFEPLESQDLQSRLSATPAALPLPDPARAALGRMTRVADLLGREGMLLVLPFELRIR